MPYADLNTQRIMSRLRSRAKTKLKNLYPIQYDLFRQQALANGQETTQACHSARTHLVRAYNTEYLMLVKHYRKAAGI